VGKLTNLFLLCAWCGVLSFVAFPSAASHDFHELTSRWSFPLGQGQAETSPLKHHLGPRTDSLNLPYLVSSHSSFRGRSLETRAHDIDPLRESDYAHQRGTSMRVRCWLHRFRRFAEPFICWAARTLGGCRLRPAHMHHSQPRPHPTLSASCL
jgi:hypothetical protein